MAVLMIFVIPFYQCGHSVQSSDCAAVITILYRDHMWRSGNEDATEASKIPNVMASNTTPVGRWTFIMGIRRALDGQPTDLNISA